MSTPEEKQERQKAHAAEIAATTHTMRDLGTTRGQARKFLHDNAVRDRAAEAQKKAAAGERTDQPQAPAEIKSDTTKFDPKPLTLESSGGKGGAGDSTPISGIGGFIVVAGSTVYTACTVPVILGPPL